MRKIASIIILIIILLVITSCGIENIELSENITKPKNLNMPLYGEWIIEDYKFSTVSKMDEERAKEYIGLEAIFHEKIVSIGQNYCLEPDFTTKNVDAYDFLIYNYKTSPDFLAIEPEEVQIVSVSGVEQFFNEFIKLSDEDIIVNIDGVFFYLSKLSDQVDESRIEALSIPQELTTEVEEATDSDQEFLNSGILLGFKSLNMSEEDELENWNYRSIFIRRVDEETITIKEMEDILIPRKNGFWKIEVDRQNKGNNANDNIEAYPLSKEKEKGVDIRIDQERDKTLKNILFVSSDYISIENIHHRIKGQRYLEVYPIDNINLKTPLEISSFLGDAGGEAIAKGFNKDIVAENEEYRSDYVDISPSEDSFGLVRRNGLWIFQGRFNYLEDENYMYKNFNIEALPTKELISFDELYIPWNVIKEKIPTALDAFTSPNGDIAAVLTYDQLLIYEIEKENLADDPIEIIKLQPGEKVVMAEWALGKYAETWEEQFE